MQLIDIEDIEYRGGFDIDGETILYVTDRDIKNMPRVSLDKPGKWTISKLVQVGAYWSCSKCGVELLVPSGQTPMDYGNKFCLNCGACMSL